MDNVGRHIRARLGPDQKVDVRMHANGEVVRLYAVDAREAIESRRGRLVGPPLHQHLVGLRIRPELTEEEIIEDIESVKEKMDAATSPAAYAAAVARAGGEPIDVHPHGGVASRPQRPTLQALPPPLPAPAPKRAAVAPAKVAPAAPPAPAHVAPSEGE